MNAVVHIVLLCLLLTAESVATLRSDQPSDWSLYDVFDCDNFSYIKHYRAVSATGGVVRHSYWVDDQVVLQAYSIKGSNQLMIFDRGQPSAMKLLSIDQTLRMLAERLHDRRGPSTIRIMECHFWDQLSRKQ